LKAIEGTRRVTDQSNEWIRDPVATPPGAVPPGDDEDGLSLPTEEDDGLALSSAPEAAEAQPTTEGPSAGERAPEAPAEVPVEAAAETRVETPAEASAEVLVEALAAAPVEALAETPVETLAEPPPKAPDEPAPAPPGPKSDKMDWYILKVQSNREESIREGLRRRVAIAGLDSFFGDIIIPTEKVTEFKAGKRKVFKRKLYPGYLVVQMEITEETWFLVRETPGIGDFTGAAGHPTPMHPREVAAILAKQEEKADEAPKLKISFRPGDRVKIKEGTFENFEGEVASIDETNGRVTVLINIFGRSTPVDIEYWQIEAV
jgi:transcriptional antiterminator NusG